VVLSIHKKTQSYEKHLLILSILFLFTLNLYAKQFITMETNQQVTIESDSTEIPASEKLVVLWTSGDPEVAKKMVFMYTYNAKKHGWWEDITLVVWGPSAKLLAEDKEWQRVTFRSGLNVPTYSIQLFRPGFSVKAFEWFQILQC
jgi:hypothetical protein